MTFVGRSKRIPFLHVPQLVRVVAVAAEEAAAAVGHGRRCVRFDIVGGQADFFQNLGLGRLAAGLGDFAALVGLDEVIFPVVARLQAGDALAVRRRAVIRAVGVLASADGTLERTVVAVLLLARARVAHFVGDLFLCLAGLLRLGPRFVWIGPVARRAHRSTHPGDVEAVIYYAREVFMHPHRIFLCARTACIDGR